MRSMLSFATARSDCRSGADRIALISVLISCSRNFDSLTYRSVALAKVEMSMLHISHSMGLVSRFGCAEEGEQMLAQNGLMSVLDRPYANAVLSCQTSRAREQACSWLLRILLDRCFSLEERVGHPNLLPTIPTKNPSKPRMNLGGMHKETPHNRSDRV